MCIKPFGSDSIVTVVQATHADGSILCVPRTMPKLTDDAIPTIFNNLPTYLSSQPAKRRKTPDERQAEKDHHDHQVLQNWHQLDAITSFIDLSNKISDHVTGESNWGIIKLDSSVCYCIIDTTDCLVVKVAVKMLLDLSVHVYC